MYGKRKMLTLREVVTKSSAGRNQLAPVLRPTLQCGTSKSQSARW